MVKSEDLAREAEVFKYFSAPRTFSQDGKFLGGNVSRRPSLVGPFYDGQPPSSSNQTLTALAQLCAIRLNAGRAMISVIDSDTQYFIAEATKSLNLKDTTKAETVKDGLWVGCTSVPKEGRLCEKTIELRQPLDNYACFTVTDLSKDDHFKHLPFVKGPPYFRFYAGTPLTTKLGVNIGSLFVIDENVRPELSKKEIEMLGTLADIVMKNVELAYEAEIKDKFMAMKDGINAFQSGRDYVQHEWDKTPLHQSIEGDEKSDSDSSRASDPRRRRNVHEPQNETPRLRPLSREGSPKTPKRLSSGSDDLSSVMSTKSASPQAVSEVAVLPKATPTRSVFSRAAFLVRQSLELEDSGGVCFLDASTGFTLRKEASAFLVDEDDGGMARNGMDPLNVKRSPVGVNNNSSSENLPKDDGGKRASVLAYSTAENDFGSDGDHDGLKSFRPLPERCLQHLIKYYPRGNIWGFNEVGPSFSTKVENTSKMVKASEHRRMVESSRRTQEARILQSHFPHARQLLFIPLWDPIIARWHNGLFCFSTKPRPVMSKEAELSFTLTFGSCIMAEHSRLVSIAADSQKADFIGSISHELRSPLHGVLASAEFLSETASDPFQRSLINTVSSCGKTLLDTINHILDYSKINKFERSWVNARNSRASKSILALNNRAASANSQPAEVPPLMNIYSTTDLAIATEEVVEGVYAGQIYQDLGSMNIMRKSADARGENTDQNSLARDANSLPSTRRATNDVEVILDIAHGDYVFTTQIGAIRRVIMNIFGNALKYTSKGLIAIRLSLSDLDGMEETQSPEERLLTISVKDTGKGIASKYLKESLYKPFSQEDTLATGVGLGLSIVKSIVTMLNGSINIDSQVGVGTQVDLHIPLLRLPGVGTSTSTPSTVTSSASSSGPNPVTSLLTEHNGKSISLYGFRFETSPEDVERHHVLEQYMIQWLRYRIAEADSMDYDLIIVDEQNLERLCREIEVRCPVVILCGAIPPKLSENGQMQGLVAEVVSKPFGPYKLAKAIQACFNRPLIASSPASTAVPSASPTASEHTFATPMTPKLERLTLSLGDNSMELSQKGSSTARDTVNANMAINTPSTFSGVGSPVETDSSNSAFPYMPPEVTAGDRFKVALLSRPRLDKRVTEPLVSRFNSLPPSNAKPPTLSSIAQKSFTPSSGIVSPISPSVAASNKESKAGSSVKSEQLIAEVRARAPRLLLVDDNKINLRLLQTYMRKREFHLVDSAENGQLAVDAAKARSDTYDIIFMDISMPVMNGFEATRAIREMEEARRRAQEREGITGKTRPALIIALTGLASERDQSEAFASGVDLLITQKIKKKKVGQLLNNWVTNVNSEEERERTAENLGLRSDAPMTSEMVDGER